GRRWRWITPVHCALCVSQRSRAKGCYRGCGDEGADPPIRRSSRIVQHAHTSDVYASLSIGEADSLAGKMSALAPPTSRGNPAMPLEGIKQSCSGRRRQAESDPQETCEAPDCCCANRSAP